MSKSFEESEVTMHGAIVGKKAAPAERIADALGTPEQPPPCRRCKGETFPLPSAKVFQCPACGMNMEMSGPEIRTG